MEIISVDIESKDPELKKKGPGEIRKDGHILGVGYQIKGQSPKYVVLNHMMKKDCLEDIKILKRLLASNTPKVMHNGAYDATWLESIGFRVGGKIHDTLIMAALLDENAPKYTLDALAMKYLGEHKGDDEIAQWAEVRKLKGNPQQYLENMPVAMVAKYCKKDVEQTLRLADIMLPMLKEQDLMDVYNMEIELFPLLLQMRKIGIRVDTEALSILQGELTESIAHNQSIFGRKYGEINIRSSKQIAHVLDLQGIPYQRTAKGNPKMDKEALAQIPGIGQDILELRSLITLDNNFVHGSIPGFMIDGRLHPQFLQTRRDEGGTVSGRFACRNPNLQQIPARDPKWGPRVRSLFIPEEGQKMLALDYDGIESRVFAHYASHGEAIRKAYNDNPDMDYHQVVADMAGISRPHAKTINFAALYGAGAKKIAATLGVSVPEGMGILHRYHARFPAVKVTMAEVEKVVKIRGYVKTISGRRARVTHFQKMNGKYYIFTNRLIQGTAADILKKAMLDAWKAGIFDVITPHLLVHDEIVASIPDTAVGHDAQIELKNIMESTYPLRVPIRVSGGVGENWSEAH